MNKQEAINKLKKHRVGFGEVTSVRFDRAVSVIGQIDEPQKVVVPKFVAEWIEECKASRRSLRDSMKAVSTTPDVNVWLLMNGRDIYTYPNQETFARAWLDGYEIEQEKLYTVEIPDPHGLFEIRYLYRCGDGNIRIGGSDYKDILSTTETHLTKSEIKQDFEWAWQLAKEVEEEE